MIAHEKKIKLSKALLFFIFLLLMMMLSIACDNDEKVDFEIFPKYGNAPLEVMFEVKGESKQLEYLWDFGDGVQSVKQNPVHIYKDTGEFTVKLMVSEEKQITLYEDLVVIDPGKAGWISFPQQELELKSGEFVKLQPEAFDNLGNLIVDVDYSWEIDEDAGYINTDGIFFAGPKVGNFPDAVTVTFQRLGSVGKGVLPITIVYGEIIDLEIRPKNIDTRVAQPVDIITYVYDKQGHLMSDLEITYTAKRSIDNVLAGGIFSPGNIPTGPIIDDSLNEVDIVTIEVSNGKQSIKRTLRGRIRPGILDQILISNNDVQLIEDETYEINEKIELSAMGNDRFGNDVILDKVIWKLISNNYGDLSDDGIFIPSPKAVGVEKPMIEVVGISEGVSAFSELKFKVNPSNAASISLIPEIDSIPAGAGTTFQAVVKDQYGNHISGAPVSWTATSGGRMLEDGVFVANFETGVFNRAVKATIPAGKMGNKNVLNAFADVVVRKRSSSLIAIEITGDDGSNIVTVDLVTKEVKTLLNDAVSKTETGLVPRLFLHRGKNILFSGQKNDALQIVNMELSTGNRIQVIDDQDGSSMPAVSPNGDMIAWVSLIDQGWRVYVSDISDKDFNLLTKPLTREDSILVSSEISARNIMPIWSPDNSRILYTSIRSDGETAIEIFDLKESKLVKKFGISGLSAFGWSNKGQILVAFHSITEGSNLFLLDVESGELIGKIPVPWPVIFAAWSSDWTELALIDKPTNAFWIMDLDGTGLRKIFESEVGARWITWN